MTTYSQKSLIEYLGLVAAEKKISKSELEKRISINDFAVSKSPSLFFGFFKTERDFRKVAKEYDSVFNIKRNFIPGYLGLTCEYKISATGVKFKEK